MKESKMVEEFLNSEEMQSFNEERNRYLTELREGTEVYCKENKKEAEKRFDKYGSDFYGYLLYCINETNKVEQFIEPSREAKELQQQDQRIEELENENAELKEKLKNAIVPKFKIGQKVWVNFQNGDGSATPKQCKIQSIAIYNYLSLFYDIGITEVVEEHIFSTEQEAQKKLKQLKRD